MLSAAPLQARRAARLHRRPMSCHHRPQHRPLLRRRPLVVRRRRRQACCRRCVQRLHPHLGAARRRFLRSRSSPPPLLARQHIRAARRCFRSSAALRTAALAATLDLFELAFCCADEMLSRVVCLLVMKPARMAYVLTSVTAGPLRYMLAVRQLPSPAP